MPRKGPAQRRQLKPDEVFGSRLVTQFINKLLLGGDKCSADKIFYGAMQRIGERTGENPLVVLRNALRNVMPNLEVRPRRVGGATYQVPVEVTTRRQMTLAVRWMVGASRKRSERTMVERFSGEIMDAANREGASVRRREEMHRMAEANKAYSHYRW